MTNSQDRQESAVIAVRTRPYDLGKRRQRMIATRQRVIEATRELLSAEACRSPSMGEIARHANVSRATLYHQFKSKFDLLSAVVENTAERSDAAGVRRIRELPDGVAALRGYVPALCAFYARDYVLLRNLFGLAAVDPDAGTIVQSYDDNRHAGLDRMVSRITAQGRLNRGFTHGEAVALLWMLTSFRTFEHLHSDSAMPVPAVCSLLERQASAVLSPVPPAAK